MADISINDYLDDNTLFNVLSNLVYVPDIMNAQNVCTRWERLCRVLWRDVDTLACRYPGRYYICKSGDEEQEMTDVTELMEVLEYCGPFIIDFKFNVMNSDIVLFASTIMAVSRYCKNLEVIFLRLPETSSTIRIRPLLNECMNLKKLFVINFTRDVEEDLLVLREQNIKLKTVSFGLTRLPSVTGNFLLYLPEDLESLTFTGCFDSERDFSLAALKRFKNLHSFESMLTPWREDLMEVAVFREMQSLVRLSLVYTFELSNSFNFLTNLVNLKDLNITDAHIEDDALINVVNNCTQIEILELDGCYLLTDRSMANICSALRNLKSLRLDGLDGITDEKINDLAPSIERFSCTNCDNVDPHGIMDLMKRPRDTNMWIKVDSWTDRDTLIAAANQVIHAGTHDILFILGSDHTTIVLTINQSEDRPVLMIENQLEMEE